MLYGYSSLISLPDLSEWNIKKVIDMSDIFYGCLSLILLIDISVKFKNKQLSDEESNPHNFQFLDNT